MTIFVAFTYEEVLTENGKRNLRPNLLVDENSSWLLIIIRLLSGSIKLTNNYSNTEVLCRKNYFTNDLKSFGQDWGKMFPKLIAETLTSNDLSDFINVNKHTNKIFYQNILSEISHFTYESKKGSHTAAFIYIYRLLEKIAYAIPLIYTSRTQDFIQSFNQLKELMTSNSEKKELGFFKKFIEVLYKDDPILITSVDMVTYDGNTDIQKQIFKVLKNTIDESIIHEDTVDPVKLSVKYDDMGSFIISIRNRFFHNMNDHVKNIQSKDVPDSDLIFMAINDRALQWISNIFLEVLSHSLSEHLRIRDST
jgi:hypothetical protein